MTQGEINQEELLEELEHLRLRVAELEHLEADFREACSKHEAIVQAFDGLIYICSPDYKVEFMNNRFIERTGNNPLGEDCFRALHGLDEICPWCVNERVFAGETVRWEVQSPKDDRWYYIVNTPIVRPNGTISKMAMISDITDRKQSEAALKESENQFRQLVQNAGDIIYRTDTKGCFTFVNPVTVRLTEYSEEELVGRHYLELIHPDWKKAVGKFYGDQLTRRLLNTYYEFPLLIKNERMLWIGQHVQLKIENDSPIGFQAIARDITDRKLSEDALRESEAKYRRLIEFSPDGIFVQVDDKIAFANSAMAAIMGAESSEDLIGTCVLDLVHPDYHGAITARMALNIEAGRPVPLLEQKLVRLDGTVFYAEAVGAPVSYQGRGARQVLVRDITERKRAEEDLRRSQTMIESILNSVPQSIFWKDRNLIYLGCNEVFARAVGLESSEEIVGKTDYDLPWPRDEADAYRADDREVVNLNQAKRHIIEPLQQADGTRLWIDTTKVPLRDESDNVYGVLGVYEDITERRRAEAALKENERFLSDVFASIKDGISVLGDDLTILRVNPTMEKWYSDSMPVVGKKCYEVYHRKDQPCSPCPSIQSLKDGMAAQEIIRMEGLGEEIPVWIDLSAFPLFDSETGRVKGVIEHVRDITDRKRAEDERVRLFAAVEQAGETILITDPAGTILYVNPAFETITGFTREEALGQTPRILRSGAHDGVFYRDLWQTLTSGRIWRGQFTNRKKDGTLYQETATISPIKDESGRIVNYVAVKRDITTEARLQKQLLHAQKMEAIGTLAGGVAHDFNNLLQAILGYSDILLTKKGPEDPDRKKLEVIQHAARDGAELVGRILTFSRKGESKVRPIDLNVEIRRVEKLLRRTLPRMIGIDLMLSEDLRIVDADPAQMEQVILNLGVNARHAMPDGGRLLIETRNVSLRDDYLRTHLGAQPGHYVLMTVSDTGAGMEPDVLDRIFEPFFTTKTNGEGTGLGLSMVHGIISQHGGYIRCYSEVGRGTSFKIYLPVSSGEFISDMKMTGEMPALGTETVLLVDDDDRIREMGRQMIEMGGYQVLTARNGEEALATYSVRKAEISLVILDLIMPGMGGKRCLEELLRIDPDVRVLIASGYSSNGLTEEEKGIGAGGFLGKPYDAKVMLGAIRKVLDTGGL